MQKYNVGALTVLKGDLKLNVRMNTGLLDKLAIDAGGFMDRAEVRAVENERNDSAQMSEVIRILQGKANKDFKVFCDLLRQCNNATWADELEKKAQELGGPGMPLRGRICIGAQLTF